MSSENITITFTQETSHVDETTNTSCFGFTRYLYIIDDVKSSLVLALLDHNRDESLFWAYELYFSGFKEDVFSILEQMVDMIYSPLNPALRIFLKKQKQEWVKTKQYCILGTYIYNIVYRPYDISSFVKYFCKDSDLSDYIENNHIVKKILQCKIYIIVEQKDVVKYLTIHNIKPRTLLKKVVKYPIRTNTLAIFDHEHGIFSHHQLQTFYWYDWLFYSAISPIWADRIVKYNGFIDYIKKTVLFATENDQELFYEAYNYEPDEQPKCIQEMNIGKNNEEQVSWFEFYNKYS